MEETITLELIEMAFKDSYWTDSFYTFDDQLIPEDTAVWDASASLVYRLLESRFPSSGENPGFAFQQETMAALLKERGVGMWLTKNRSWKAMMPDRGFVFTIAPRENGYFVSAGGWDAPESYTTGSMEAVADWMAAINDKFDEIRDYVRTQYNLERKKAFIDHLLCTSAQALLPEGISCQVWHIRYLNDISRTERLIGIIKDGDTIGDTVILDENNIQSAVVTLLQDKEVQCFIHDLGDKAK